VLLMKCIWYHQKKELVELEQELQCRAASVASHRMKVERLQAELALLHTQQLGLRHALAADLSPPPARPGTHAHTPVLTLSGVVPILGYTHLTVP
jgi:hypothetical protein